MKTIGIIAIILFCTSLSGASHSSLAHGTPPHTTLKPMPLVPHGNPQHTQPEKQQCPSIRSCLENSAYMLAACCWRYCYKRRLSSEEPLRSPV